MKAKEDKAKLIEEAKGLVEKADAENRYLTEDQRTRYDEIMTEIDNMTDEIQRREKLEALKQSAGRIVPGEDPKIGMTKTEIRQYSLVKALRAAMNGNWSGAELEKEASHAVAEKLGKEPRSFYVPADWSLAEKRDLVVGTPTAGGYTVATDLLVESFIDMLKNKMVVQAAGAKVLSGLVGDAAIPRQTGGATSYWVAESGVPTASQAAFDQVALAPETIGAYTDISRKLLLQSSIDVENFVRDDLASALALGIDLAALHGSGTGAEPTGIQNITGVGSVAIGVDGGAPTWAHIIGLETEVAIDNADVGNLAYVTNVKVRGKLKQTEKAASTGLFVWGDGDEPLNGYPAYVTNQVKSDLTKGTGTLLSAIFFGNWADLIIPLWGSLDVLVDPFSGSTSGTVRVVAFQDVNIAVRHPESFAVIVDAATV